MSEAKERHLLFTKISDCIVENDGIIFGGFVRDTLLHHEGAMQYYRFSDTDTNYEDSSFHPESFTHRNTYPNDIDVFVPSAHAWKKIIDKFPQTLQTPFTIKSTSRINGYSQHPNFTLYFSVHRYVFDYTYDLSLQNHGKHIFVALDVVIPNSQQANFDFFKTKCMYDCSCNLFYINKFGLHHALATGDVITRALKVSKLAEMTVNKICFIPKPSDSFASPDDDFEIRALSFSKKMTYTDAKDFYITNKNESKYKYRAKIIKRIIKLHTLGWNILNSPYETHVFMATDSCKEICNNEIECYISKEEFTPNSVIYRIRDCSKSFMKESSLLNCLDNPTPLVIKNVGVNWAITCPMTRKQILLFDQDKEITI